MRNRFSHHWVAYRDDVRERRFTISAKWALLTAVIVVVGTLGIWRVVTKTSYANQKAKPEFSRGNVFATSTAVANIEVLSMPDGKFRMFFHRDGVIGSATSNDGKNFYTEPGTRVQGEMPATTKLSNGKWRMYFVRGGELLSAISDDAFNFKEESGIRLGRGASGDLDAFGIAHPSIVQSPEGFRLYYDGVTSANPTSPQWRIMSAYSQDGLVWTKDRGSRIPIDTHHVDTSKRFKFQKAYSPDVYYRNGLFVMLFTAQGDPLSKSGIWRATSLNGTTFKVEKQPILGRDPKFGNTPSPSAGGPDGMPQNPFLINIGGRDQLFYWTSDQGYAVGDRLET